MWNKLKMGYILDWNNYKCMIKKISELENRAVGIIQNEMKKQWLKDWRRPQECWVHTWVPSPWKMKEEDLRYTEIPQQRSKYCTENQQLWDSFKGHHTSITGVRKEQKEEQTEKSFIFSKLQSNRSKKFMKVARGQIAESQFLRLERCVSC